MRQYSFKDVTLLVQGVEMTGFDEGDDVITLERTNESANDIVGADGELTVSLSADRSGTCTFRLLSTSDSNAIMSGLIAIQENGPFVPTFFMVKDNLNNDLATGTFGYIPRPATMVRGQNVQAQEWVIKVERLDFVHVGGSDA